MYKLNVKKIIENFTNNIIREGHQKYFLCASVLYYLQLCSNIKTLKNFTTTLLGRYAFPHKVEKKKRFLNYFYSSRIHTYIYPLSEEN